LFEFYPNEIRDVVRPQIASSLKATITQKLLPAVDGGRVPAIEAFWVDPIAKQAIEMGEFEKIGRIIDSQENTISRSFNTDLMRLVQAGKVAKSDALAVSPNPQKLEMNLKGIFLSGGGIVN
jgi:twitching motility protein PilT